MFSDTHISYFRGYARETDECDSQVVPDQEEEEETEVIRPSMTAEHKAIMNKLYVVFPHKFLSVNNNVMPAAQKVFALNNNTTPIFKLDPILTGTWLDPPKVGEDLATGLWPENTIFPKGVNPYTKGYELRPPPRPTDISITDSNLKLLLEASKIKEANLNSTVFRT